ncbi:WD repeat-containing protein 86-like protein [Dinothrombium tinctorium]|uniref:WD repeat-containing protein 86-like protein n=1 Tax=Dinothrombium tinctorium TaxID=1965070 RepID=A0A3S3SAN6_9ACAR|nr:WD repeat-containing protein 86-like protein [Dinothrombium tinctorium]RWS12791.1 WD repeat-containing protein 86-like protein [Dinothrombium tinctorium]RWS16781.1 WD repeat-containing protein 86-like protein [Dinothrombium tinctorium]
MGCAPVKGIAVKKAEFLIEELRVHESGVTCLAISEDKSLLVTGTESGIAIMWSAFSQTAESLGKLVGHTGAITCCVVHERFVITGSMDSTIRKWSIESGMCLFTYRGHTSSYDKTAKAWTLQEQEMNEPTACLRTFKGHSKSVYPIVFVPFDKSLSRGKISERDLIITGSADFSIKIWSFAHSECLKTLLGHTAPIHSLELEPMNKKHIFSTGADGIIICWDFITGENLRELKAHVGAVLCTAVHKRMLYSGSSDRTVRAWVMEFGECTRVYVGNSAAVSSLQYYNGLVCVGLCDGIAHLFDAKSGTLKRTFEGHSESITGLQVSEKRTNQLNKKNKYSQVVPGKMFTTCASGKMCVWDISGLKEETVFGSKLAKEGETVDEDCEAVKEAIRVIDYFLRR